jgi:DNA processing protein
VGAPERFELRLGESGYPEQLAAIPDPPNVLYGMGDPGALGTGVSIVGARRATPYGLAAARVLAGWAAEAGYSVISGGAVGCDQAAHVAALARGGVTVAVLGGGADVAYPRGSGALLREIAAAGAVVSEHPWGSEPKRWTFRTRNRIIAGLGAVLLVLEASVPSGTFSTVDYALDAGRCVATVPGSIFAPECRGPNRLLRQGAVAITEPADLALLLQAEIGPPSVERACAPVVVESDDPLLRALLANPMRPDDVARELSLDIVTVARALGRLESAGLVGRYRDGRYGPC